MGAAATAADRRVSRLRPLLPRPAAAAAARHRGNVAAMNVSDVPVVSVSGLRKSYGNLEVLRGLDFAIRRGECFGLLGPNGAGKTTTLRCCLGLIDPNAGTITLVGEPVPKAAREARVRVGVVPQMDNIDPDFTVVENLIIYGRYFRMPDALINKRIPWLLEFAGLAAKGDANIRSEEHTSELQSRGHLVCRLLLEKKK